MTVSRPWVPLVEGADPRIHPHWPHELDRSGLSLTAIERLAAAVVVSAINGSAYHVNALRRRLDEAGAPAWLADTITTAPQWPAVDDDRLAAVILYAARLTTNPSSICEQDLERLRAVDLTELDIYELAKVVASFNAGNRVALGLGLR